METEQSPIASIHNIRQMMERSSRFISLSGLSGIGAGICALLGAAYAWQLKSRLEETGVDYHALAFDTGSSFQQQLLTAGVCTFVAALCVAVFFTYLRSKKTGVAIWGTTARRLLWNTSIPLAIGGIVVYRLLDLGLGGLVAPSCLLFYGLALINGSKYTVGEIRWLGYCQLVLGIINLWMIGHGLILWAIGFGVLHIVYGIAMWLKYERNNNN